MSQGHVLVHFSAQRKFLSWDTLGGVRVGGVRVRDKRISQVERKSGLVQDHAGRQRKHSFVGYAGWIQRQITAQVELFCGICWVESVTYDSSG